MATDSRVPVELQTIFREDFSITLAVFFCAMSYVFSSFINILAELRFYAARRAVSCECKVQNV